jgi:putative SOS response-associated peptidase YedK
MNQYVGNLPPMPGVFPDYPAPVVRNAGSERELILMRWGMPLPPRTAGPPVTNIRHTSSPHWRAWLEPRNRCLVPANSFAEYAPEPNPETKKKDVVWFALNEDRPLFAFGGLWTEFRGDRGTKSKPVPGPHLVYGFLTTAPNSVVEPIFLRICSALHNPTLGAARHTTSRTTAFAAGVRAAMRAAALASARETAGFKSQCNSQEKSRDGGLKVRPPTAFATNYKP